MSTFANVNVFRVFLSQNYIVNAFVIVLRFRYHLSKINDKGSYSYDKPSGVSVSVTACI